MTSEADRKVALALLKDVAEEMEGRFGSLAASPNRDVYDFATNEFCQKRITQCDIALKKAPDDQQVGFLGNMLKARLYGINGMMKQSLETYDEAIDLAGDDKDNEGTIRYWAGLTAMGAKRGDGGGDDVAIAHFERVVETLGLDSEYGLESAKELEKLKAKATTKGGCFIATAAYGSPAAQEVRWLSDFRDSVLVKRRVGRHFIRLYYHLSPSLADLVRSSPALRAICRWALIGPMARLARAWLGSRR